MMALDQVYFDRYPEKFVKRDLEEVRLGYLLTRFCLLEKALDNFPDEVKGFFRQASEQPEAISRCLEEFRKSNSGEELSDYFNRFQTSLLTIKNTVDELPEGMIKERFLGGISFLFKVVDLCGNSYAPNRIISSLQGVVFLVFFILTGWGEKIILPRK